MSRQVEADNARRPCLRFAQVSGHCLLNDEKSIPIQTERPPHKMVSRGGSIGQPSADPDVQWAWAIRNLERLAEALRQHSVCAGKLTLLLDFKHGPSTGASASLGAPTDRFDLLLESAKYLWPKVLLAGAMLYRMHYIASHLQYRGAVQLGLFDPSPERDEAIRKLKQDAGTRHGRFALRSAATLPLAEIYADESHGYEICDIAGKTCF